MLRKVRTVRYFFLSLQSRFRFAADEDKSQEPRDANQEMIEGEATTIKPTQSKAQTQQRNLDRDANSSRIAFAARSVIVGQVVPEEVQQGG